MDILTFFDIYLKPPQPFTGLFFIFGGHESFLGATDTTIWTSGDVSSGFQSQSGQPYSRLVEAFIILSFFPLCHTSVTVEVFPTYGKNVLSKYLSYLSSNVLSSLQM